MNVVVEFSGLARILSGERRITLDLDDSTTYQEVVKILADRYPKMVGQIIDPEDVGALYPSNMISLNGKHMVQPDQMEEHPQDGDHLILMTILAGG